MIVRDPRASFMCSAVHSPVNDKIDPAVLIDSEDLDIMLRHIVPDESSDAAPPNANTAPPFSPLS